MTSEDPRAERPSSKRTPPAGTSPGAQMADWFRQYQPQDSHQWNFSGAFTRLAMLVEELEAQERPPGEVSAASGEVPAEVAGEAGPSSVRGRVRRVAHDVRSHMLEAWVRDVAHREADPLWSSAPQWQRSAEVTLSGLQATLEALRFLSARVDRLEEAADHQLVPIEGLAWVVPPPALDRWIEPVVSWLVPRVGPGTVVHAEGGDGALVAALTERGVRAEVVEPRGGLAWDGIGRGLRAHAAPATEGLAKVAAEGLLGGVVLSGVVDRTPIAGLLELLDQAMEALAPGSPLVIVGLDPEAVLSTWSPIALDLVPGRPLHSETWQLLLRRAGYSEVEMLGPEELAASDEGAPSYAIGGRRPS